MEIHHSKHHAGYTANLNSALENAPDLANKAVEELVADLASVPDAVRNAVQNNGGGFINHALFWKVMGPGAGNEPQGSLTGAMSSAFGDFASFQEQFSKAGMTRFGSGWAWLVVDNGMLKVTSTPNQDSPLSTGQDPILGLDVWEHAYYLNYQNRRADYIAAWWNVVNWTAVAENYEAVMG
jgi:Fe-Mn family superoxide dismutase